jgi:glyoxylase-like metal-dependent hydrolase (beta-lactamase superfamily II)
MGPQQWEESMMEEIVPDVFTWRWYSEPHGYDFNGHFLRHSEGNICIDPVQPSDPVLDELMRMGAARILITNRNHCRAANLVRDRLGARTGIHPEDAAHARGQGTDIDDTLRAGERIGPLDVIAAAGKSPGEVALLWRGRRILIVGDAVIGHPPGRCSLLPEKVMDDPVRLRRSVRALLDLEFEILLVGDGVSILSGAKDRLRDLTCQFPD